MSLHDEYARQTPFELTFPDPTEAESFFRRVSEEADARGADTGDLQQFLMLSTVGAFVRDLRGSEGPAVAVPEYGALAFHAFHFAGAGGRLDLVSTAAARHLVAEPPTKGPSQAPGRAGYLQLPQHLFWTSVSPGEPPQSVDGLFWTLGAGGLLYVLLALGLRPDRGLLVVPLPEAPWEDSGAWASGSMREEGDDFSSDMPGADLDDLYAFESAGEVLKLLTRVFVLLGEHPASVGAPAPVEASPVPSTLPFFRVEPNA
jgi:hypothetical protein